MKRSMAIGMGVWMGIRRNISWRIGERSDNFKVSIVIMHYVWWEERVRYDDHELHGKGRMFHKM